MRLKFVLLFSTSFITGGCCSYPSFEEGKMYMKMDLAAPTPLCKTPIKYQNFNRNFHILFIGSAVAACLALSTVSKNPFGKLLSLTFPQLRFAPFSFAVTTLKLNWLSFVFMALFLIINLHICYWQYRNLMFYQLIGYWRLLRNMVYPVMVFGLMMLCPQLMGIMVMAVFLWGAWRQYRALGCGFPKIGAAILVTLAGLQVIFILDSFLGLNWRLVLAGKVIFAFIYISATIVVSIFVFLFSMFWLVNPFDYCSTSPPWSGSSYPAIWHPRNAYWDAYWNFYFNPERIESLKRLFKMASEVISKTDNPVAQYMMEEFFLSLCFERICRYKDGYYWEVLCLGELDTNILVLSWLIVKLKEEQDPRQILGEVYEHLKDDDSNRYFLGADGLKNAKDRINAIIQNAIIENRVEKAREIMAQWAKTKINYMSKRSRFGDKAALYQKNAKKLHDMLKDFYAEGVESGYKKSKDALAGLLGKVPESCQTG